MGAPVSTIRKALCRYAAAVLLMGCNDFLVFQEGKPFPDSGPPPDAALSDADGSVGDVADGAVSSEGSDVVPIDAPETGPAIDAGDAGCTSFACGGCI